MTSPQPLTLGQILAQMNGGASTSNRTSQVNVNPQGQLDVWGLGEYSGNMIPNGTLPTYGHVGDEGAQGDGQPSGTKLTYSSLDSMMSAFNHMSQTDPNKFVQLQQALYATGKYGETASPKSVGFGTWNSNTKDALKNALKDYYDTYNNGSTMMTFTEWMAQQNAIAKQNPFSPANAGSTSTGGSSAKQFNPSSPALISQTADQQAQTMLGHSLDSTETNQLVGQVQGEEQNAFDNGDVYLRGITPASAARTFVVQNNLPEYASHQVEGYMNAFADMFLNGASQRANTGLGDVAVGTS